MSMTKIKFPYDGMDYELKFTADSIKKMERDGFNFAEAEAHVLTAPEDLFCGAFIANHPYVQKKKRVEIYNALCNEAESGETVMEAIGDMLTEAIEELQNKSGNIKWTVEK